MARTKRNYETWVEWIDNYGDKLKRDGSNRELPARKKTETNRGYGMEGTWKRKAKRRLKRLRIRDDRKELDKNLPAKED